MTLLISEKSLSQSSFTWLRMKPFFYFRANTTITRESTCFELSLMSASSVPLSIIVSKLSLAKSILEDQSILCQYLLFVILNAGQAQPTWSMSILTNFIWWRFTFFAVICLMTKSLMSIFVMFLVPLSYIFSLNFELPQPTIRTESLTLTYLLRILWMFSYSPYLVSDNYQVNFTTKRGDHRPQQLTIQKHLSHGSWRTCPSSFYSWSLSPDLAKARTCFLLICPFSRATLLDNVLQINQLFNFPRAFKAVVVYIFKFQLIQMKVDSLNWNFLLCFLHRHTRVVTPKI